MPTYSHRYCRCCEQVSFCLPVRCRDRLVPDEVAETAEGGEKMPLFDDTETGFQHSFRRTRISSVLLYINLFNIEFRVCAYTGTKYRDNKDLF